MAPSHTMKVLELCKVAPPPGTTTQTTLPLTLFDLLWIACPSVEHLLFYEFPHSKTHFTQTLLPHIKHSLSLALQEFFPLCGNLKWSQEFNTKPTLSYMEGDSISLTLAESREDNFNYLVSNHAREAHNFHPLVPKLVTSDTMTTVLAVQVTLFPKHGICVGFTVHHGIADGNTALQFMRTWSSLCRLKEDSSAITLPPFYDRSVIKDPEGLEDIYLNDLRTFKESLKIFKAPDIAMNGVNMVRTTFILSRTNIKWLNEWLLRLVQKKNVGQFYTSTYVLICAYVIVCLVKARRMYETKKTIQIAFPTGCRTRLNYPIPATYFGNLIGKCTTSAMKCDMIKGEYGFLVACEGIGRAIGDLENGVMQGAEKWVKKNLVSDVSNECVMVAGTLKLSFYEIDFGWGRPRKSEIISLEKKGAFSLAESRDGDGGVEVGLTLDKIEMDTFSSLFVTGLKSS